MREIRQSGSEGGAVQSRPYPYRTRDFGYSFVRLYT
jgi:hypothetical protein